MTSEDRWLEIVVRELKRPVEVDREARARVLEAVKQGGERSEGDSLDFGRRRLSRYLIPLAAAAGLVLAAWFGVSRGGGGERGPAERNMIQFVFVAQGAARVHVVGDFNDWDTGATPLQRSREGDVWSVVVPLLPGRYRYSFLVDGDRWVADESKPSTPADEFGVPSSVIWVEGNRPL